MIDGMGSKIEPATNNYDRLNEIINSHASYIGPHGGACIVNGFSTRNQSTIMQEVPRLYELGDKQYGAGGNKGTFEIQSIAQGEANLNQSFNVKILNSCCIMLEAAGENYVMRTSSAAHGVVGAGVLTNTQNQVLLAEGDTIREYHDGDEAAELRL